MNELAPINPVSWVTVLISSGTIIAVIVILRIIIYWRMRAKAAAAPAAAEYTYADLKRDLLNPAVSIDEILVRCRGRFPEKPPDPDPNLILLLGALPVFFLWRK